MKRTSCRSSEVAFGVRSIVVAALVSMSMAVSIAVGAGCGPIEAVDAGRDLFESPRLSISPSNVFSCATCHATTPDGVTKDGTRLSGYTLFGASQRPTLWGGNFTLLFDAANFCVTEFMRGAKLTETDGNGLSLLAYLQSLEAGPQAALPLTIVANINDSYLATLPPGEKTRGSALYDTTCAPCHGSPHDGKGRLGSYVSLIPDDTVKTFGVQARAITVEKIRHGKFFGISGNMPFYSREALSDAELSDLVSYLLP